jgi:hypothetical protein
MDDLIAFLRAQLDEDERVAAAADGPGWGPDSPLIDGRELAHIARWDPARVLAEVEAKRRVIDVLRGYEPNDEWDTQPDMGQRANNAAGALRALAQSYAGRDGWREEWSAEPNRA